MMRNVTTMLVALLLTSVLAGCGASTASIDSTEPQRSTATATSAPAANESKPTESPAKIENGIIKIVSSFPGAEDQQAGADGIKTIEQRLAEDAYQTCDGNFKIVYENLRSWDAKAQTWSAEDESRNAQQAAADPDVMAYIGPFFTNAAKISIPILNRANLVMLSPSATWPGLTKPGRGELGEPEVYYPTGKRNFARIIPADDIQGVVAVQWMQELGAQRIYILHDNGTYGKGLADIVQASAKEQGLEIVGYASFDPGATSFADVGSAVVQADPDLVYFGGLAESSFPALLRDLRAAGYRKIALGPDGLYNEELIREAGDAAANLYVTFGGLPPDQLTGAGRDWYENFKETVHESPDAFAPYSYESMSVILAAINQVCVKDREVIRQAVMSTKDFDGLFGRWSFDEYGDSSLTTMSGLRWQDDGFQFVKVLGQ